MSHITKYTIKVNNLETLKKTLGRLQQEGKITYTWLGPGTQETFSGPTKGTHFKLNNWAYPICVTDDGDLLFDNYGGKWGDAKDLDICIQRYNQELITDVAKRQGYMVNATTLNDGTVRLKCYL